MSSFWSRFSYWQNKYMADRLGKDWATSGVTVTADGFAEQTAGIALIYGAAKALFGCEPKGMRSKVATPKGNVCEVRVNKIQAVKVSQGNYAANLLKNPQGQFNIRMKG